MVRHAPAVEGKLVWGDAEDVGKQRRVGLLRRDVAVLPAGEPRLQALTGRQRHALVEAAEILGQSVKTLRRRFAEGTLPAYRFGPRYIRVRLADLEASGHRIPSARQ